MTRYATSPIDLFDIKMHVNKYFNCIVYTIQINLFNQTLIILMDNKISAHTVLKIFQVIVHVPLLTGYHLQT